MTSTSRTTRPRLTKKIIYEGRRRQTRGDAVGIGAGVNRLRSSREGDGERESVSLARFNEEGR